MPVNCPTPWKTVHGDRTRAKRAARRSLKWGRKLKAYKCPGCGFFHLTSTTTYQPQSERVGEKLRGLLPAKVPRETPD